MSENIYTLFNFKLGALRAYCFFFMAQFINRW
jgi:heme/copper-type cytochrome/quinol oxidase subunit 1